MSEGDQTQYNIYVGYARQQFPADPVHWLIIVVHPGADLSVRLHCEGWPGRWEVSMETNKRFQSHWIECKFLVGNIPAEKGLIVTEELKLIPPQTSQIWVLHALLRLEWRGLVPAGTYDHWKSIRVSDPSDEDLGPGPLPEKKTDSDSSDQSVASDDAMEV
ncbi:hypothetical protein PENSTE_c002G04372 [Penicillium steckii]|uniref:Uncharacterized protein n=1 Tax=Penicillium steckii TaxID=303698 RepID=A0A1V6TT88_9EURO|nr:hypothetical protein PENSTE_c002G04372 [Penicillium steckii]